MAHHQVLPIFLQHLVDYHYQLQRPGEQTVDNYDVYFVDLTEWKLRFADRTPLIWVETDVAATLTVTDLVESLKDVVRKQRWQHRKCIILLDGVGAALKKQVANQYAPLFIVIDETDQQHILSAPSFTGALQTLICNQIPLSSLSPYEVSTPVEGSSFFGRQQEVDRLLRHTSTNYAVIGIRRLGKSSLLKEVQRRLRSQDGLGKAIWLDCSTLATPQHLVQELVRRLNIRELPRLKHPEKYLFFLPDFLRRMAKMHHGQITVFLDEIDQLLQWPRHEVKELLSTFRNSVHNGDCRYIVAGFQSLMDEFHNLESPFYLAFEPLYLEPFKKKETAEMVLQPMSSLRIGFKNAQEIVNRIHEDTRGHPLLVQHFCVALIEMLDQEETRVIMPEYLERIYSSNTLKMNIVNVFRDNVSTKDKFLVYALLCAFPYKAWFTQEEMYGALQRNGYRPTPEEIDRICERLILAGIFTHRQSRYLLTNPLFPKILATNFNLNYLLSVAKKEMGL